MSQSHTLLTATSSAPGPAASSRTLHCSPPTPGQALIHGFHSGISILVQSGIWVTLAWVALGAWASLAAVGKIDGIGLATMTAFLFQIYTLDRYVTHPEDQQDGAHVLDPAAFVARHRKSFRYALFLSLLMQLVLVVMRPWLLVALAISWGITVFYVVRVPLLNLRLKQVPFFKNVYAPTVLTAYIVMFLRLPLGGKSAPVLASVFIVVLINVLAFDMKDVDNDRRAGLRLISTELPPQVVYALLIGGSLLSAALFLLAMPRPWSLTIAVSLVSMAGCILRLSRRFSRSLLFVVLDGLAALPLLLAVAYGLSSATRASLNVTMLLEFGPELHHLNRGVAPHLQVNAITSRRTPLAGAADRGRQSGSQCAPAGRGRR